MQLANAASRKRYRAKKLEIKNRIKLALTEEYEFRTVKNNLYL